MPEDPPQRRRRRRPWLVGCFGIGIGLPLLCATILFIVFKANNRPPQILIPTPVMPVPNAFDDFVRAGQLVRAMKHKSPYSMVGPKVLNETLANFAACANDAVPVLTAVRNSLSKPYLHPPVRSFYTPMPQYGTFRSVARTVIGAAGYYARIRQPGKAIDILLDGMEMGVMIPRGGTLMADLNGTAIEAICTAYIEPLIPQLSTQELAHVAKRLDAISAKRLPWSSVIVEEGWNETASWREILRKPDFTRLSLDYFKNMRPLVSSNVSQRMTPTDGWQLLQFGLASKSAILRENLEYYRHLAHEAERTVYTGTSVVPVPNNLIMRLSTSQGNMFVSARSKHEASRVVQDILRIEVAIHRYRKDRGAFPPSLSLLTPVYLASIPNDPLAGVPHVPFRYRVKDNGSHFLLYSLGTDLVDGGGTPARHPADQPGDIVAGRMRQPRKATP
jgi:hypothetical protein